MQGKRSILSIGWVLDIMKWFKRWGVKDLLALSGNATKYVINENRLLEALRMKWQYAKMSNLEYNIPNINPQYWFQYKVKMSKHIQSHLTTHMSLGPWNASTLLQTHTS